MSNIILNNLLAEETGIHVGDGSMNVYNGIYCYTVACHHIDDRKYVDEHVTKLYKKVYDINITARSWSKGTYGFRIHNRGVVEFKRDVLNLPLGKKRNISVPRLILDDDKLMKNFLRGFADTDGSINHFLANKKTCYPRLEMSNISCKLMEQINNFLTYKGFRTSVWRVNKNRPNWNVATRISINGFSMLRKWNDFIGFNNPKHKEKLKKFGILE